MGSRARGRPPEPRSGPDGTRRAGRRQAPHRPLAERPGRHGSAVVAAPRDRPARRRPRRVRARAGRPGRTRGRRGAARHDAHPARPARAVRAPPPRLCRDGRARPRPACRRPAAAQRLAAWGRRPRGSGLPARSRGDRSGAGLRRRHRELARRRLGPRLRRRGARRGGARDGPPQPVGGGAHLVVEPALRVRAGLGRVLDRQLDHAQQEEPGSRRARPWPCRPDDRRVDRGPHDPQGPPARVPARPAGGQAAAVRGGRHLRGQPRRARRHARHAYRRSGAHAGGRRRGLHDRNVGRGHARPPGRPVPRGAPHRRHAGGSAPRPRGSGSRRSTTTRSPRRWRPATPPTPGSSPASPRSGRPSGPQPTSTLPLRVAT